MKASLPMVGYLYLHLPRTFWFGSIKSLWYEGEAVLDRYISSYTSFSNMTLKVISKYQADPLMHVWTIQPTVVQLAWFVALLSLLQKVRHYSECYSFNSSFGLAQSSHPSYVSQKLSLQVWRTQEMTFHLLVSEREVQMRMIACYRANFLDNWLWHGLFHP